MIKSFLICAALFCLSTLLLGQELTISGTVISENSKIPFAVVYLESDQKAVVADSIGQFTILVRSGKNQFTISAMGYETKKIGLEILHDLQMDFELSPARQVTDEVVVTGLIAPTQTRRSALRVDVYNKRFIQSVPSNSAIDALHYVNGLQQVVACGVCGTNDIHINGMEGPYTLVLIDGMPIMSSLASVYALNGIPNSIIEQIEVIKGPSSTVYGTSAVGGVINIITTQSEKANKLAVNFASGSYGENNVDVSSAFVKGKNQFLVSANLYDYHNRVDYNQDGFTDVPLASRVSLFGKWRRAGRIDHAMALRYFAEDRFGGELEWQNEHKGGDKFYGEFIKTRRMEVTGSDKSKSQNWSHDYSLSSHDQKSFYGVYVFNALQQNVFSNFSFFLKRGIHSLRSGLSQRLEHYRDNTPVGDDRIEYVPGIFVLDNIEWSEAWGMMLGMRMDHHSNHGLVWAPQVNLKWRLSAKWEARINTGRGFRTVNVFTEDHAALTGAREVRIESALQPESSWNITGVLTRRFTAGKLGYGQMDLDAFINEMQHKILPDYDSDPNAIIYRNASGKSISRGVSLAIAFFPNQNTWLKAGGNLLDVYEKSTSENRDAERINQLFVPRYSVSVVAGWKYPKWAVSVDYSLKHLGPMQLPTYEVPFQKPEMSDAFAIHNIQVTKNFGAKWSVGFQVRNLFDYVQISPLIDPANPFGDSFDTSYAYGPLQHRSYFLTAGFNIPR
ncbi:MAG: TonB-dependent receptor domain-containing protein [Flavobacteriales bacterium]